MDAGWFTFFVHHCVVAAPPQGGPVLVEGPPGSGKSAAIWDLAHRTGNAAGVIELHLDDSIDSKSLLGTYVCTDVPGEFTWSPGPLTQAVVHGRYGAVLVSC
jgi:midasin